MPLHSLTSLRFFAALMVVFSHLGLLANSELIPVKWVADNIFYEGYIGVTFFFVLSGFILSHSYDQKLRKREVSNADFWIARVARIFPLHLLSFAIALPLTVFAPAKVPAGVLAAKMAANATLLQAFIPSEAWYFSMNAVSWSLSVELLFYLLFPLLVLIHARWLLAVIASIIVLKMSIVSPDPALNHFPQYIFPPLRLADFAAGIALHRLFVWRGPVSGTMATSAQVASVSALTLFIGFNWTANSSLRYDIYYLLPMCGIVISFAWQNGALARAISGRVWILLGEASFALYLVHQLIIRYAEHVRRALFPGLHPLIELILATGYVLLSIAVSVLLYRLFEVRSKRFVIARLSAFWGRKTELLAQAPAK